MKKQLVIIGIIALLLVVGLSGCEQLSSNQNSFNSFSNLVEISNLTVYTTWTAFENYEWVNHRADGFYRNYSEDALFLYYYVGGTVKNIANKPIDSIAITVKFYDDKGNFLQESHPIVKTLYLLESKNFTAFSESTEDYFEKISDYTIEITDVTLHQ